MKAVFGVAGDVGGDDLVPLREHLDTGGSVATTVQIPDLGLMLVGRSTEELDRWQTSAGNQSVFVIGRPLHPTVSGARTLLRRVVDLDGTRCCRE
jgi:hypothetical protein